MVIWLDDSIASVDFTDEWSSSGLSAILTAAQRGWHYVTGSRLVLRKLANNSMLGESLIRILRRLEAGVAQSGQMRDRVTEKIVVFDGSHSTYQNQGCWAVRLSKIGKVGVTQTILLGEDLEDVEAFFRAGKHYAIRQKFGSVPLDLRRQGGGGTNIVDALEAIAITEQEWCLCITDSDRRSPAHQNSPTAAKCAKVAATASWPVRHECLGAREIENILPRKVVANAVGNEFLEKWDLINDRLNACGEELYRYGDLKYGTFLGMVAGLDANSAERAFWMKTADAIRAKRPGQLECDKGGECGGPSNCRCPIVPGLGGGMLKRVLELLERNSDHHGFELAHASPSSNEWFAIGRVVFEWCCGASPVRA